MRHSIAITLAIQAWIVTHSEMQRASRANIYQSLVRSCAQCPEVVRWLVQGTGSVQFESLLKTGLQKRLTRVWVWYFGIEQVFYSTHKEGHS